MVFFRVDRKTKKVYPVLIHRDMEGGFASYGEEIAGETCAFCQATGKRIKGPHVHSEPNPRILGEEVFHLGNLVQLSKKERARVAHKIFAKRKYYEDEFYPLSRHEYEARLLSRLSLASKRRKSKDVSDEQIRGESVGLITGDEQR
jgi:hypothetical protein